MMTVEQIADRLARDRVVEASMQRRTGEREMCPVTGAGSAFDVECMRYLERRGLVRVWSAGNFLHFEFLVEGNQS